MNLTPLLSLAVTASKKAAQEILTVYRSGDFQAEAKGDDSPLTLADKKAHQVIVDMLSETNLPILSEEGKAILYDERKVWEYFWMVDPLDGTKEFLKRNDEFTVNIALIHRGRPILGVVTVPVTGDVYFSSEDNGAFLERNGVVQKLPVRKPVDFSAAGLRVVASRSHMTEETQAYVDKLKDPVLVSKGSSLKFMLIAEGKADLYPRFAPTMEWDTAAAHAIITAIGFHVLRAGSRADLMYNKPDLLNPSFEVA